MCCFDCVVYDVVELVFVEMYVEVLEILVLYGLLVYGGWCWCEFLEVVEVYIVEWEQK